MDVKTSTRHRRWTPVALLLALLLAVVLPASAAYRVQRPIIYDGGRLNQSYLYGEVWGTSTHKGVDFSYGLGTNVYAISDGTVVDLYEDYNNGDDSDPLGWGNRVLIRHSARHWDRTTQQWAYVYSICAHLSKNSVRYSVGQFVYAGTWIAEVDDTGWSSGHHLHLQICLHPQSDRTITTLSSSTTSRNPELWLQAFNYGGTNTGAVVGKVTDGNGQPIGDRYIWGLLKPQGSSGTTYQWSRTYAYSWANPDDILVENWGTTDVLPGSYHLFVKNESGSYTYEDLGWHTVEAGKTTYVGLYPVYLPDIMENYYGWNSSIVIRNNSDSKTAQVNTTFFRYDGAWVYGQKTDYIAPRSTVTVDFPGYCYYCRGSAVVVASEDVSVVVVNDNNSEAYAYTGIPSGSSVSGVSAGTEVFVPCNLYNYYGWFTTLYVQNTGAAATTIHAYFYDDSGIEVDHDTATVNANGRASFSLTGAAIGSAKVTATQPLAVVVRQDLAGQALAYPGISSGGTTAYFPVLLKDYYGWYSAYQTQEVAGAPQVTVYYYPGYQQTTFPLSTRGHKNVWMGNEGVPNGLHSAKESLSAGGQVATAVHHANATGALGYQGFKAGARDLTMPSLKKNVDGWDASLTVQNVGTANAQVTLHFYHPWGSSAGSFGPFTLQARHSRLLYNELPGGFNGSVWIHSEGADIVAAIHQTHSNGRSMGYGVP